MWIIHLWFCVREKENVNSHFEVWRWSEKFILIHMRFWIKSLELFWGFKNEKESYCKYIWELSKVKRNFE